MLIRIIASHFVAGYDIDEERIAPIIKYMMGWDLIKIRKYCNRKRWNCEIVRT
jgi:hypothetical protein